LAHFLSRVVPPLRPKFRSSLLLLTCCSGLTSVVLLQPVDAQTTTAMHPVKKSRSKAVHHTAAKPTPARAATGVHPTIPHAAPVKTSPYVAHQGEEISVSSSRDAMSRGGGMMHLETVTHAAQTIGRQFIEMRSPTSTAFDLIKTLPSVNVNTPDTSGMQGGAIQIRGLTDSDMALMVNDAPAASANYMAEDIDSENLESVTVTPGSSATDLPATSSAGGVLNEVSRDPGHEFGGLLDFSYGTNNLSREFIRVDSGEIGNSGVRTFLSFSNAHARSWMGAGINERKHLDFGARKDWTNGSYARLFASWNYEDFTIDNYPTASQFLNYKHTGNGYGNKAEFDPANNDYWKDNIDHWNQIFIVAPVHVVLTRKLSFDITPWFDWGQGWDGSPGGLAGAGYTNYAGTPVSETAPVTSYFLENHAFQFGATAKFGYDIDKHNHLQFGYWYENEDYLQYFPESLTLPNGANPSPNAYASQLYVAGSRFIPGNDTGFELHSLFIDDTAKYLNNKLTINPGFKFVMTNYWYETYGITGAPSAPKSGENLTAPLPHLSIGYMINDHNQIYVNAEGDFRQPDPSSLAVTSIAGGKFPNSEYSIKEELGYRYHDKYLVADLSLFNYNITNRLLSTYVGAGQSATVNAGNETIRGFDLMLAGQPIYGFSPYVSFEYLHGTLDSNIAASDVDGNLSAIHTKGMQAPQAPHVMANFGLTYTHGGFFANGTVHYTGPQSVTLAGDERIPGYVTDTLSLGYHFKPYKFLKAPSVKLNFTNLTGAIVRTGSYGVGTNATLLRLMNGNMIASTSEAQFYVEPRFSMTGTISTSF